MNSFTEAREIIGELGGAAINIGVDVIDHVGSNAHFKRIALRRGIEAAARHWIQYELNPKYQG